MRQRISEAALILTTVGVAARVTSWLLEPLLVPLTVLVVLGGLVLWMFRGPHAGR